MELVDARKRGKNADLRHFIAFYPCLIIFSDVIYSSTSFVLSYCEMANMKCKIHSQFNSMQ